MRIIYFYCKMLKNMLRNFPISINKRILYGKKKYNCIHINPALKLTQYFSIYTKFVFDFDIMNFRSNTHSNNTIQFILSEQKRFSKERKKEKFDLNFCSCFFVDEILFVFEFRILNTSAYSFHFFSFCWFQSLLF